MALTTEKEQTTAAASSVYGRYEPALAPIMEQLRGELEQLNGQVKARQGDGIYEHLICRVKQDASMREKCDRKGLPQTEQSALRELTDAIGIRVITRFIDDIYTVADYIRTLPGVRVEKEKDYIRHAKPNGYRSYHMILSREVPFEDPDGNMPGRFFIEVQLRTIAMDSWASLEHQLKYKQVIRNQNLIVSELKRCADELAGCDLSMQTIRDLIREGTS